jgi:hypothetical protein
MYTKEVDYRKPGSLRCILKHCTVDAHSDVCSAVDIVTDSEYVCTTLARPPQKHSGIGGGSGNGGHIVQVKHGKA